MRSFCCVKARSQLLIVDGRDGAICGHCGMSWAPMDPDLPKLRGLRIAADATHRGLHQLEQQLQTAGLRELAAQLRGPRATLAEALDRFLMDTNPGTAPGG